jgi:di/tricarboxylate transporter
MKTTARNRIPLAVSFVVVLSLALSLIISSFHSHGDGCRIHYDCAVCLWTHEAIAVTALFFLSLCRMLIGIIWPHESDICSVLLISEKNGRAPPAPLT